LETRQEENPSPKTKSEPKRTGETIRKKVNSKIDGLISLDRKKKSPGGRKKKFRSDQRRSDQRRYQISRDRIFFADFIEVRGLEVASLTAKLLNHAF
jgi:hypothetical protein